MKERIKTFSFETICTDKIWIIIYFYCVNNMIICCIIGIWMPNNASLYLYNAIEMKRKSYNNNSICECMLLSRSVINLFLLFYLHVLQQNKKSAWLYFSLALNKLYLFPLMSLTSDLWQTCSLILHHMRIRPYQILYLVKMTWLTVLSSGDRLRWPRCS